MKKIILTLHAVVFGTLLANAQWSITGNASTTPGTNFVGTTDAQDLVIKTNNAERMRILSGGNVAIGTTTGSSKLTIKSANSQLSLQTATDATDYQEILFKNVSGGNIADILSSTKTSSAFGAENGGLAFFTGSYFTAPRVLIKSDGKVGIGTTAPPELLTARKDQSGYTYISIDNGYTSGSGVGSGIILTEAGTTAWYMRSEKDGTGKLNIGNASSNKITIKNSGTILTAKTDFNGYTYMAVDNGYSSGSGVGSGITFNQSDSIAWYIRSEKDGSGKLSIGNHNSKKVTINSNGDVGIGTSIPDAKLTVKGGIHAEEVLVDLSVPGPDYVFDEKYSLKSLDEVENFINKNHHLEEIPSAAEMEKNGVDLGTMNMKLLQKVEELTLYIIELNKNQNLLKEQNIELSKKIVDIEKREK